MEQTKHPCDMLTDRSRHVVFAKQENQEYEREQSCRIGTNEELCCGREDRGVCEELWRESEKEEAIKGLNEEE
jgi:hypothetical protein